MGRDLRENSLRHVQSPFAMGSRNPNRSSALNCRDELALLLKERVSLGNRQILKGKVITEYTISECGSLGGIE